MYLRSSTLIYIRKLRSEMFYNNELCFINVGLSQQPFIRLLGQPLFANSACDTRSDNHKAQALCS